jgi:hypothetical protein
VKAEREAMNSPQDQSTAEASGPTPKRRVDPALARRNRRTAGFLVLLALTFLLAFLNNFGVFK